ncbi:peptide deformylase [Ruminococcus sp.]|uniref:peptide deformylase n=1 Tax=Ruminococcus sp. TaxID=41978 RepID=UPI0025F964C7|nr:peptide deformylase [Ruminococcus sp.]
MALRKILNKSDEILHKVCKPVTEFDDKLGQLLDDMTETLVKANGVGLAGPQVAKLRRVVVIIIDDKVYELINPEITWQSEETQRVLEGCLSCPGEWGYVTRPMRVKFKAQDRHGKWYEMETSELFAQCVCHELAHLEGHLFTEIVEEFVEVEDE